MARQEDRLARIAHEAFALLDSQSGRTRKAPPLQNHHQQSYDTYQDAAARYTRGLPLRETRNAIPRNYETAGVTQFYGGQCVYQRTQIPIVKETVISSDEAARMFGGVQVVEYQIRKPTFWT
ncbi:hypothetical protein ACFE04_006349 [Oxalis oulophora]